MSEAVNGNVREKIPADQMLLVTNAGFTEHFMGGIRERSPEGGFVWRNPQTGARMPHPLDVTRKDPGAEGTILAQLQSFCANKPIPFVWTIDHGDDQVFVCRIGVKQGETDTEAALLGHAQTPSFGFSIAIAMLQASGYDFYAARQELIEDAPRIQLDG